MSKINRNYQQQLDYITYSELIENNLPTEEDYAEYCEWQKEKDIEDFYQC
ncbi:hypothetical protein [Dysgonomonas sp. 520]|nr:hypothetical protein [Dysgonomonas sp. 520]